MEEYNLSSSGVHMSRDVEIAPSRDSDLEGLLKKILKELIKMNLYLALMTDLEIENEDIEV